MIRKLMCTLFGHRWGAWLLDYAPDELAESGPPSADRLNDVVIQFGCSRCGDTERWWRTDWWAFKGGDSSKRPTKPAEVRPMSVPLER